MLAVGEPHVLGRLVVGVHPAPAVRDVNGDGHEALLERVTEVLPGVIVPQTCSGWLPPGDRRHVFENAEPPKLVRTSIRTGFILNNR